MTDTMNNLVYRVSDVPEKIKTNLPGVQFSEPLWKRVPTRDESGKPYADFMMLIPGLKNYESSRLRDVIAKLESALRRYENSIILADLNLKLNVLWVTIEPRMGLTSEIASLIHHLVPEAKLVSQHKVTD